MRLSLRVSFAAFSAALVAVTSGLAFGYSSAAAFQIFLSIEWAAIFASCLNVGGLLGSLLSGYFLSNHGRRWTMIAACLPGFVGWVWLRMSAYTVYEKYSPTVLFISGRLLTGLSAGMAIPSSASYLVEIAPPGLHGMFGTLTQIGIVTGISLAYAFGACFPWEQVALINSVLLLCVILLVSIIPESPKWLVKAEKMTQACDAHTWLFGSASSGAEPDVMKTTQNTLPLDTLIKTNLRDSLFPCRAIPANQRSRLRIVMLLMILQQFSGINAILYFAESVCMFGGLSWPSTCALLLGLSQLVFTVGAAFFINRVSRKRMLNCSGLIMCVAHLLHGFLLLFGNPYSIVNTFGKLCIVLFLFGFSIGWGPLPILVSMDLFPVATRGFAAAAGVAVNWVASLLVTAAFEPLSILWGPSTMFWVYSAFCFLGFLFTNRYIPDTIVSDTY
ncbi:hypothetical protein AHF37_02122 [Paragonimus kellicotti]|nr:hypothetical protein AHF37_02122 [Paragonimus kellicotti]